MAEKEAKISLKDNNEAAIFFGSGDNNFKHLRSICPADISARGADIYIKGNVEDVNLSFDLINNLIDIVESEEQLNISDIVSHCAYGFSLNFSGFERFIFFNYLT